MRYELEVGLIVTNISKIFGIEKLIILVEKIWVAVISRMASPPAAFRTSNN
jgi:hypothetical protein